MKNINCKKDKDRILCVTVRALLAKRPGRPVRYVGAHNFYYQPAGSKEIAYLLSMPAQIEYVCRYELGAAKAADELLEAVPARRFDGERDAA